MKMTEVCDLANKIPNEEIKKVFDESLTASAELDHSFLAFEEVYKGIVNFVPKHKIIVDLGCAYAFQAYYFKDYKQYIGIDCGFCSDSGRYKTANTIFYNMTIQDFCKKVIDENWNLNDVFAICSYVPDDEARDCARKTFPNCLVYYPN